MYKYIYIYIIHMFLMLDHLLCLLNVELNDTFNDIYMVEVRIELRRFSLKQEFSEWRIASGRDLKEGHKYSIFC